MRYYATARLGIAENVMDESAENTYSVRLSDIEKSARAIPLASDVGPLVSLQSMMAISRSLATLAMKRACSYAPGT